MENQNDFLEWPPHIEQKIAALIAALKADLAKLPNLDFNFDEEHRQMFLEHAKGLAPFIPGMIPDDENDLEEMKNKEAHRPQAPISPDNR